MNRRLCALITLLGLAIGLGCLVWDSRIDEAQDAKIRNLEAQVEWLTEMGLNQNFSLTDIEKRLGKLERD